MHSRVDWELVKVDQQKRWSARPGDAEEDEGKGKQVIRDVGGDSTNDEADNIRSRPEAPRSPGFIKRALSIKREQGESSTSSPRSRKWSLKSDSGASTLFGILRRSESGSDLAGLPSSPKTTKASKQAAAE